MNNKKKALKHKIALVAAGVILLQHTLIFAAPVELSLADSINLALTNNPALQIAGTDKEKADWSLTEAKGAKAPTISLGSGYSAKNGLSDGSLSNSLRMNWSLYTGGRTEGQISQAEQNVSIADLNVLKAKQELVLNTTTAYYNVLQSVNMVAVNEETVKNLTEHLDTVQAKYEAGVVAKSEVLRSEVELANARQNLIKAQNTYQIAVNSLNNIIKTDNKDIKLKEELKYTPYDKTLEDALALIPTRPDIRQAEINVKIADTGVNIAEGGKKPSLSASMSTGWNDSLLPKDNDWSVGLSASWNVFDAGLTNAKVKQAELSLDKTKIQVQQAQDAADQEVRQAYLNMQEAEKRLESTEMTAKKASEDLYIAKEKYLAGVGTNLDVFDAQLALTQARTNHVQALYDFNVNKAKLDKATGLPAGQ